jgi:hypothetical protein
MQTSMPSIAFIFLDEIEDVFFKNWPKEGLPKSRSKTLGNHFFVQVPGKQLRNVQYFFELHGRYIVCKEAENGKEIAYMDIKYAFLKKVDPIQIKGKTCYGLKFVKKRTYEQLFTHDRGIFDAWFNALKGFCILSKFRVKFESIDVVAQNDLAKVLRVRRQTDGREFAVKVFPKAPALANAFEKKCLLAEVKMLRKVNHHRLLKLHEIYEGENFVYFLCAWYPGPTLMTSIIQHGNQPEAKAYTIMFQILEALAYLHSRQIVHRDLKPDNVIMRNANDEIDVVLIDLGFATHIDNIDRLFSCCGTPGYVAQEVLAHQPYDCKADVYSAGLIFYTM